MEIIDNIKEFFENIFNIISSKINKSIILVLLVLLLLFVLYLVNIVNPMNIKENKFTIIGLLVFIFLEIQIYFYFLNSNNNNEYFEKFKKIFTNTILIIGIILFTVYFVFFASRHFFGKNVFSNILLIFLQFFLIITVLSIIYLLSENPFVKSNAQKFDSKNMDDPNYRFIKNVIFFIPCLLIDFIDDISKFFGTTPKIGYILLLLMIILVVAILKLPNFINNIINKDSLLLKGPVYLNNKKELGTFQEFTKNFKPQISKHSKDFKFNDYHLNIDFEKYNEQIPFSYQYEIDCKIYINPQPTNTSYAYNEYTNLFTYGDKPKIEYLGKENKLKITCETDKNKSEVIYESVITNLTQFRLLRWNDIKLKFDGANMDVFINSHLVATQKNILPHMNYDKIIVGENNGIHGGIKDVYFYNHNKPVYKIDNSDFTI